MPKAIDIISNDFCFCFGCIEFHNMCVCEKMKIKEKRLCRTCRTDLLI